MSKTKRAPIAATIKGSKVTESPVRCPHWHFITGLMLVTTLIAEWNIKDVWSGIVALMCGLITIAMVMERVGGFEDETI